MTEQEMMDHIKRLETEHYEVMSTLQQFFLNQAEGLDSSNQEAILRLKVVDYVESVADYLKHPDWDK